jgi:hypothetical protein
MLAKLWQRACGVTSESGESLKSCSQWLGKLPNALSSPWPGKTYVPTSSVRRCSAASLLQILDNRQSDWADGFSFFTVFEPQTARFGVRLGPLQADHFAASAAGERDLANDIRRHRVPLFLGGFAQHLAQRPILRFGQSPLSHVVLWLAETVRRIGGRDDPSLGGIGYARQCRAFGLTLPSLRDKDKMWRATLLGAIWLAEWHAPEIRDLGALLKE